jgi:thioesterase domain-containing protein
VALSPPRGGPGVFCIHPVGGNVVCYRHFAQLWTTGPVHGLRAYGTAPGVEPHFSIDAMADAYSAAILSTAPAPVYRLLGWSMGGLIALETARRLASSGRLVRVAALDTWVAKTDAPAPTEALLLGAFLRDLGIAAATDLGPKILAGPPAANASGSDAADAAWVARLQRLFELFRVNSRAIRNHRARTLEAPVMLLEAAQRSPAALEYLQPLFRDEVWRTALPHLEHRLVQADHFEMVKEEVLGLQLHALRVFFA